MYLKTPGSTRYLIKDQYEVWIPKLPDRHFILNSDLKRSDQFWRRTPLPKFYEERRLEEAYHQDREQGLVDSGELKQVSFRDPVLENYRRQEWFKRTFGVFFMNNGVPIYLTGKHYFYLQWCKMDHPENDGYPLFYLPQIDRFYFRDLCWEDPYSYGYLMIGPRGFGKTSEESAFMIETMTRPGHNRHAAIQSKTEDDAKITIFQEKMVPMFNNLPDFFKPQYSHGSAPTEKMTFRRLAKKGIQSQTIKHGDDYELGNTILCYPPHNKALDGKTLSLVINDEIGKLKPDVSMDAYTRHAVNYRCVFRNQQKRGIIAATTTVEEMDQGGDECYEIWEESDPTKRDGNGNTVSKIYRLFVSAVETQTDLADKFGVIPREAAYAKIMNEREPVKEDNAKLTLLMRKNPTTVEEAFLRDQTKCQYDVMILSKRISELERMKNKPGRKYSLEWVNGKIDGDVELVEYKDGPLTLYYDPDVMWSKSRKLLNACESFIDDNNKRIWLPVNNDLFRSATDPIRFVKSDDKRASQMAAHGMMRYIPDLDHGKELKDWISNNIMWEYLNRDTDPENDYENVIKLMRYFGHSIMPENNAGDFVKHLFSRGYQRFVIVRKNFDASVLINKFSKNSLNADQAVHSNTEVIESYVRRTAAFIRRHGHRINSLALLKQLLEFDPKKPTKYDLAVSFGYAIISLEADLDEYDMSEKQAQQAVDLFTRFDVSGNTSRIIQPTTSGDDEDTADFENPLYWQQMMSR
ncbi:MAG: hypothetical protein QM762_12630 [Chryseolinea sp.]